MFECDGAGLGSRLLGTLGGPVSAATISVAPTMSTHMSVTSAICIRIRWCSNVAYIASSFLFPGRRQKTLLLRLRSFWVCLGLGQALTSSFPCRRTSLRLKGAHSRLLWWQVDGEFRVAGPGLEGG